MSLSDDELRAAFDKARWLSQKDHTKHGLRAVAEAAVKDAVGGEAKDSDPCPNCMKGSVCRTIYCGRLKLPLDHPARSYDPSKRPQASAAVPDLSACFITAESGGGEYKIVLRFQTLAKMQDAHSAMVHWLAASQPETKS